MSSFLKLSLLFFSLCYISAASKDKVKVAYYYEAFCPYAEHIIIGKIYPAMNVIGDYVTLDFVPFGNAWIEPVTNNVTCEHGQRECYGNKLHACAIQNHTQKKWLEFVYCTIGATSNNTANEECAIQNKISWSEVKACVDGEEGDKLILENGKRTENANVQSIPYIVFNDLYNKTLERYAEKDFLSTICHLLKEKPAECKNRN